MKGGWFVGKFEPSCFSTDACEVAVKSYSAGEENPPHYHKVSTEITLITSGRVRMSGQDYIAGDIVTARPGEINDFVALEDSTVVVVKVPASPDDKYLVDIQNNVPEIKATTQSIKAVIFDLDGVLVDATDWHYEALNRAL
jgi:quercetin dioxygenase-like cupin family protein